MPAMHRRFRFRCADHVAARPARWCAGPILALGLMTSVGAQGLQALYESARGFDATYLAALAAADSAQYRAEQVHALRRPQVGLGINVSRSHSDPSSVNPTERNTSATVTLSQMLFNRVNDVAVAQADRHADAARADLEAADQDLIVRVAQAYFDVLTAQEALAAAQAGQAAIAQQLGTVKRNFDVGTGTITDTREAQARFDLATAQTIAADNGLRTARIALETLIGSQGLAPRPLLGPFTLASLVRGGVEEWVTLTEVAPVVRKALIGYDVAKLESDKARSARLPTVSLIGSVARVNTAVSPSSPMVSSGSATTNKIEVMLSLPLFTGHATENRIKETLALEDQTRNLLVAARRIAAQSTRVAYFGVQSLQAQVTALEAAEASSQSALEATQLGYKAGVRVNLDVLNAQTQLFNTRRDLAKARFDLLVNTLKLRQAAGSLRPDDIGTLSRLLAP